MKITRDMKNEKLWIDQERYLQDILSKFHTEDCDDANQKLSVNLSTDDSLNMFFVNYRRVDFESLISNPNNLNGSYIICQNIRSMRKNLQPLCKLQ